MGADKSGEELRTAAVLPQMVQDSPTESIGVVIADDDPLVRQVVRTALDSEPDLHVIGDVGSLTGLLELLKRHGAHVALVDPSMEGFQSCGLKLQSTLPESRVRTVVYTRDQRLDIGALVAQGVTGALLKSDGVAQLPAALRAVAAGHAVMSSAALARYCARGEGLVGGDERLSRLTNAEREVLRQVALGRSTSAIASQLSITEGTVKSHVSRILSKLEARDRVQAVVLAYQMQFVTPMQSR